MGYASDGSSFANADGAKPGIPKKALLMRNIVLGCEHMMSALTHFYALSALDFVKGPGMPPWTPHFDDSYYHDELRSGSGTGLGIFAPGYTLHPTWNNEVDELNGSITAILTGGGPSTYSIWGAVIADYVLALQYRRMADQAGSIFSGGLPHPRNLTAGGITKIVSTSDTAKARGLVTAVRGFIVDHYIPLVEVIPGVYPAYENNGDGTETADAPATGPGSGHGNFLAYGCYNEKDANVGDAEGASKRLLARGYWINGRSAVDTLKVSQIIEHIDSSKYDNMTGNAYPKHPSEGYTDPNSAKADAYSWIKSPRISDGASMYSMEVGPLARMWVNGDYRSGNGAQTPSNHATLANAGALLGGNYYHGISAVDRHRARAFEALKVADAVLRYLDELDAEIGSNPNGSACGQLPLPKNASGYGLNEAPRGALAHFVSADANSKIANYQCVVPTTWNASPTAAGSAGAIEQALVGAPLSLVNSGSVYVPVEGLRVIHSFDPCVACAVHVVDADGKVLTDKKIK